MMGADGKFALFAGRPGREELRVQFRISTLVWTGSTW